MAQTSLHVDNIGKELFSGPSYLQDGNVVEFTGESATGKSALIQHLMITCLLPKAHNGCNCGVIYFDLDCHLDLLRIISIMEQKTGASEADIKLWLKNLFVVRCDSTENLVITLHSLEPLIANSKLPIGMIVLDSISSFYWMDSHNGGESQYLKESSLRKTVQILDTLKQRYRLCILASVQQLTNSDFRTGSEIGATTPMYKSFLSRQWLDFVTHRFVLKLDKSGEKSAAKKYVAHHMSAKIQPRNFLINCEGVTFV